MIKSVDTERVRRAMDAWASRLFADCPEVVEIVVFGSFCEGRHSPGSDLDVLLLLSGSDVSVRDRIPRYLPGAFPVGVDLFPFTRREVEERRGSPVLDAVRSSRWRYHRPAGE